MPEPPPRRRLMLLFALGALVRLGAWLAGADRAAAFAGGYQGDAPVWVRLVATTATDPELVLPFRPPGMIWLTGLLTDGRSFVLARATMVLLGAMVAPLVYLALRRGFAERIAFTAGIVCALATSLAQLASGLHTETPYLFLFALSLGDFERLREGRRFAAVRWSALQAAACLFRVDHLAFVAFALGWLLLRDHRRALAPALVALTATATALLPWQWHAARAIEAANTVGLPSAPPASLPLPGALPWDRAALDTIGAMPAFARTMAFRFVDETLRARGRAKVTVADLDVLREAYGTVPEPLHTPLVALYGPLNFFLANCPEASGGFTRSALDRVPPLAGGPRQYPAGLLAALQRIGELAFDYPPHLQAVNHGYRLGLEWIRSSPGQALALVGRKLALAWRGAATGIGGLSLPCGPSGVREPVDLVTPEGPLAGAWRMLLLALTGLGLWQVRRHAAAAQWLLWLAAKLVAVVMFFGYARLGALCVPTLALLWALGLDDVLRAVPEAWRRRGAIAALGLVVALEVVRWCWLPTPVVTFDATTGTAARDARAHVNYR